MASAFLLFMKNLFALITILSVPTLAPFANSTECKVDLVKSPITAQLNLAQAELFRTPGYQGLPSETSLHDQLELQSQKLETLARLPLPKSKVTEATGLTKTQITHSNLMTFLLNDCQSRHWGDSFDCEKDVYESKAAAIAQCKAHSNGSGCEKSFFNQVIQYRMKLKAARLAKSQQN